MRYIAKPGRAATTRRRSPPACFACTPPRPFAPATCTRSPPEIPWVTFAWPPTHLQALSSHQQRTSDGPRYFTRRLARSAAFAPRSASASRGEPDRVRTEYQRINYRLVELGERCFSMYVVANKVGSVRFRPVPLLTTSPSLSHGSLACFWPDPISPFKPSSSD